MPEGLASRGRAQRNATQRGPRLWHAEMLLRRICDGRTTRQESDRRRTFNAKPSVQILMDPDKGQARGCAGINIKYMWVCACVLRMWDRRGAQKGGVVPGSTEVHRYERAEEESGVLRSRRGGGQK